MLQFSSPHFSFGTEFQKAKLLPSPTISLNPIQQASKVVDFQTHSRALAKIMSLEKSMDKLREEHSLTLKELHQEIAMLQNKYADLSLKKTLKKDKDYVAEKKTAKPMEHTKSQSDGDSIYLILKNQKQKYQHIIDRLSNESKRKSYTIKSLNDQLKTIKNVLGLAGLELDMKELQAMAHPISQDPELPTNAENQGPADLPIAAEDPVSTLNSRITRPQTVPMPIKTLPLADIPEFVEKKKMKPHPPPGPPPEKRADLSYVDHILQLRNQNRDSNGRFNWAVRDWTEARVHTKKPNLIFEESTPLGIQKQSSFQSLVTSTVGESTCVASIMNKEDIKLPPLIKKSAHLPVIHVSMKDEAKMDETATERSRDAESLTSSHYQPNFHHTKHLPSDLGDMASVNQWKTESLLDHSLQVENDQGEKPVISKYSLKIARTRKLREKQAKEKR